MGHGPNKTIHFSQRWFLTFSKWCHRHKKCCPFLYMSMEKRLYMCVFWHMTHQWTHIMNPWVPKLSDLLGWLSLASVRRWTKPPHLTLRPVGSHSWKVHIGSFCTSREWTLGSYSSVHTHPRQEALTGLCALFLFIRHCRCYTFKYNAALHSAYMSRHQWTIIERSSTWCCISSVVPSR